MIVVAILEVRLEALDMFRKFERHAAKVMQKYGACIEQTVVIEAQGEAEYLKEIHFVRFPGESAFQAYREDKTLAELAHLREQSVISTQILIGMDGPDYHAKTSEW